MICSSIFSLGHGTNENEIKLWLTPKSREETSVKFFHFAERAYAQDLLGQLHGMFQKAVQYSTTGHDNIKLKDST